MFLFFKTPITLAKEFGKCSVLQKYGLVSDYDEYSSDPESSNSDYEEEEDEIEDDNDYVSKYFNEIKNNDPSSSSDSSNEFPVKHVTAKKVFLGEKPPIMSKLHDNSKLKHITSDFEDDKNI